MQKRNKMKNALDMDRWIRTLESKGIGLEGIIGLKDLGDIKGKRGLKRLRGIKANMLNGAKLAKIISLS